MQYHGPQNTIRHQYHGKYNGMQKTMCPKTVLDLNHLWIIIDSRLTLTPSTLQQSHLRTLAATWFHSKYCANPLHCCKRGQVDYLVRLHFSFMKVHLYPNCELNTLGLIIPCARLLGLRFPFSSKSSSYCWWCASYPFFYYNCCAI